MAVRKAEVGLEFEDLNEEEDTSLQTPLDPESLVDKSVPGIDSDKECCCRARPCNWNDLQKEFADQRFIDESEFDPKKSGSIPACCVNVSSKQWSFFKCRKGKILDSKYCEVQEKKVSSIDSCADKLTWWFRREDWYKLLGDYPAGSAANKNYEAYVPCLTAKRSHVDDVVIHKLSFFNSGGWANPVRTWVVSREECNALAEQDLKQAIELSYDQMCKFPIKSDTYHPNFQPSRACTFNKSSQTVQLSNTSFCPEGHRCACPVYHQDVQGVNSETWKSSPKGISKFLTDVMLGPGRFVSALTSIVTVGTLATAGAWLTGWNWPVALGATGTGLFVYGSSAGVQWLMHSCKAKVGCFAMGCEDLEKQGCRVALDTDGNDTRNPYWFLPPPMHKCTTNMWGQCRLSVCTADDARHQRVGEFTGEYGLFKTKTHPNLMNCQPTLAQDMTFQELHELERRVSGLRSKEQTLQRRQRIRSTKFRHYCPHMEPTEFVSSAQCKDGSFCDVTTVPGPNCCLSRKGMKQCPSKFPKLCADNFCDSEMNNCNGRGGVKECVVEDRCPFLLSTLNDDTVLCHSGESFHTSHFNDSMAWCEDEGGLARCPWNKPVMCASKNCTGEYCCAVSCDELEGPRRCEGLEVRAMYSGAMGGFALTWHLVLSVLAMFFLHARR